MTTHRRGNEVLCRLVLCTAGGDQDFVEIPPVHLERPRETLLAVRVIAAASAGGVSRARALRELRMRGAA
jgi:hypothetical protein